MTLNMKQTFNPRPRFALLALALAVLPLAIAGWKLYGQPQPSPRPTRVSAGQTVYQFDLTHFQTSTDAATGEVIVRLAPQHLESPAPASVRLVCPVGGATCQLQEEGLPDGSVIVRLDVYRNGLWKSRGVHWTWDAATRTITFTEGTLIPEGATLRDQEVIDYVAYYGWAGSVPPLN